ncbi:hypothetical protein A7P55_04880 [Acinetobacter sp. Ac_5812]|nr:hypothetical protein [Acinetobacter sp. Ac_5812]
MGVNFIDTTIQAAYIQGVLGFLGALIGAIVLIISIRITARNTLNAHKLEKLAEAKRDMYVELIGEWHKYINIIYSYKLKEEQDFYNDLLKAHLDLNAILHKSSFISIPEIKLELIEAVTSLSIKFQKIVPLTSYWFIYNQDVSNEMRKKKMDVELEILRTMKSTAEKFLNLEIALRKELGVKNDLSIEEKIRKLSIRNAELAERCIEQQNS